MTAQEQQKKVKEKISEYLHANGTETGTPWDEVHKMAQDSWRESADELLFLLDSLGVVIKASDQDHKLHDMDSALFAEGYAAAVGDMEQSGFVKVIPVKE